MKKVVLNLGLSLTLMALFSSCSTSYTTMAVPKPSKNMLVTSGDLPNKEYEVLGFVESTATEVGFGIPTETKVSEMKTNALNNGLVSKGEAIGADAIINVTSTTSTQATYFFLLSTNIYVKGTAIKFK